MAWRTLHTELPEMVQNNLYLIGALLPDHRRLQVTLVDADNQGHPDIVSQHALGQRDVDLLVGVGQPEVLSGDKGRGTLLSRSRRIRALCRFCSISLLG